MHSFFHKTASRKIAFTFTWMCALIGALCLFIAASFTVTSGSDGFFSGSLFAQLGLILGSSLLAGFLVWFIAEGQLSNLQQLTTKAEDLANTQVEATSFALEKAPEDLKRLNDAIHCLGEQNQGLLRNMREIMDHIAHDILTPVTRLRGHAEIQLHRPGNTPEVNEACGGVVEECDHIMNLVNAILKIAALESGLKTWEWQTLDLVSLIEDGCDLFTPVIDQMNLELALDLPQRCLIRGDRAAVQRMIANFLDNAIKYTPAGGKLRIGLDQRDNQVFLTIADTGVGIDENEHGLIFQRFYRGDQSRTKPGHGLGLSYCFFVVQAMGGHIALASKRDQGTTFTITIPDSLVDNRVA